MSQSVGEEGDVSSRMYTLESSDPDARLVDRGGHSAEDIRQIGALMSALGGLRAAEQKLSDASQQYMKLGSTDMKALHFLIVSRNMKTIATPGAIAGHLGISTASTTKLLDRLEKGGHITRAQHPTDRRALAIEITASTYEAALETVGRQQAKRFHAAARLSPEEREVVIGFLTDMTQEITLHEGQWGAPESEASRE